MRSSLNLKLIPLNVARYVVPEIDSEETKNDSFRQLSVSGGFLGKVGVSIFSWLKIISY